MGQPNLEELLEMAEVKGKPGQLQPIQKIEVLDADQDPLLAKENNALAKNWQSFSMAWVWMSLASFVCAQYLMHGLIFKVASSAHGMAMMESLVDLFTYFLGGFMIGVVSPRVRVWEPAIGAVVCLVLTLNVGMWLPFSWMTASLVKTLVMSCVVFGASWQGAVVGEKLTRQM